MNQQNPVILMLVLNLEYPESAIFPPIDSLDHHNKDHKDKEELFNR